MANCLQRGKAWVNKSITCSYSKMLWRIGLPFETYSLFLCLMLHSFFVVSRKGHWQRSDSSFCILRACSIQRSMGKSGVDTFNVFFLSHRLSMRKQRKVLLQKENNCNRRWVEILQQTWSLLTVYVRAFSWMAVLFCRHLNKPHWLVWE